MGTNTSSVISGIDVPMFLFPRSQIRKLKLSVHNLVLEPKKKSIKMVLIWQKTGAKK
jgi:hypothetical protein